MVKVYAVTCLKTGRAYIGITAGKLAKRLREHRCMAKSGTHHSVKMVEEWSRKNDSDFIISTIEVLRDGATLTEKREAEGRWLKIYEARGKLLNASNVSFRPREVDIAKGIEAARGSIGNRWSPETNRKRRLAQLGKPKGHGAKISATKQARREQVIR